MTFAIDTVGHPDPQAVKDSGALFIAQYVGTAFQRYGVSREQFDGYRAAGVPVLLIFEEWASQFLGGADAAQWMIGRMLASCAQLGVTPGVDFLPAVALVDPNPGAVYGHEDDLEYFALTIDALLGCEWTGYGSAYGLERAAQVAPHMTRRWGVGTWGYGERGDGTLPDPLPSPADMIQHGNRGYVDVGGVNCDPNTVLTADMGQWPRPAPTTEGDAMFFAVEADPATPYCYVPPGRFIPVVTVPPGVVPTVLTQETFDTLQTFDLRKLVAEEVARAVDATEFALADYPTASTSVRNLRKAWTTAFFRRRTEGAA